MDTSPCPAINPWGMGCQNSGWVNSGRMPAHWTWMKGLFGKSKSKAEMPGERGMSARGSSAETAIVCVASLLVRFGSRVEAKAMKAENRGRSSDPVAVIRALKAELERSLLAELEGTR